MPQVREDLRMSLTHLHRFPGIFLHQANSRGKELFGNCQIFICILVWCCIRRGSMQRPRILVFFTYPAVNGVLVFVTWSCQWAGGWACSGFFIYWFICFQVLELPHNAQMGRHGLIEESKNCEDMLYTRFNAGFLLYLEQVFADDDRIKWLNYEGR